MKRIAIIGGGISGLAVMHYLKKRFGTNAPITLFEQESCVGGTIRSFKKGSFLFEWGPDGFLDNQPATLQLAAELGLNNSLIEAQPQARKRFIQIDGNLYAVPMDLLSFINTPLLTSHDKWSLIKGLFKQHLPKNISIYEYVCRRFSPNIAESIVDPFMSGIYAGDIHRLHLSAFPKLKGGGFKRPRMRSFVQGMSQIIQALGERHQRNIKTDFRLTTLPDADITVIATPAYAAADIVKNANPSLADLLNRIVYAPAAVVGLGFKRDSFKRKPEGFGYLVPSKESKDILGVLIESNVYTNRASQDEVMLRVILGGMHHPQIIGDTQERLLAKAIKEIDSTWGLTANPIERVVKIWPRAIPQYEMDYPLNRKSIAAACLKTPGIYLCANYLDGISFNDCIRNARSLALAI
jgi:protoporphyrinogen/coproporphyrinogen III oxidase